MSLKLYLETTIFNYYFEEERDGHDATMRLFEAIGAGQFEGYTSDYATLELRNAPEPKRTDMMALIQKYNVTMLDIAPEVLRLGELYIQAGVIPGKYRLDALHIAIASVNALDCVLSFNYEHINKLKTKRITENINLMEGYKGVTICTPMEVLD
jgi:predicted nucleic acid-binding protein